MYPLPETQWEYYVTALRAVGGGNGWRFQGGFKASRLGCVVLEEMALYHLGMLAAIIRVCQLNLESIIDRLGSGWIQFARYGGIKARRSVSNGPSDLVL